MKRLISLALVLLMAAVAVDASAQASKLVGKWSIDPTTMIVDIGKFPNMSLILEVDADGEAEIQSMCQGEASIDDTVSIHFILKIDFNFNWTLTGNTLSLQDTGEVVADVDNVAIKPYNAEYAELVGVFEAEYEAMLESEFRNSNDELAESIVEECFEIILLDDTTLKLKQDDGNVVVCTRYVEFD